MEIEKHGDTIIWSLQFFKLTGPMMSIELEEIGLHSDDPLGHFKPDRLEELMEFCRVNPEYHIISCFRGGDFINRPVLGCKNYYLGRGDANPRLNHKDYLEKIYSSKVNWKRASLQTLIDPWKF